jgi:hypothetical protein
VSSGDAMFIFLVVFVVLRDLMFALPPKEKP